VSVTLSDFFKELPQKSTQLFREFIWILESKHQINPADLLSGRIQLSLQQKVLLKDWVEKRDDDYPLQYFLGQVEFFDLEFYVEPGVLIPRLETEEIARWSVDFIKDNNLKIKSILDIGAGSGCLGLSVAKVLDESLERLTLIEPHIDARKSLSKNIKIHGDKRVELVVDTFETAVFDKKFDLILSNPPYISVGDEEVQKGVYKHEPHEALYAGAAPITLISQWVQKAHKLLNKNSLMVFEMGYSQRDALEKELEEFRPQFLKDSFGKDRFFYILN